MPCWALVEEPGRSCTSCEAKDSADRNIVGDSGIASFAADAAPTSMKASCRAEPCSAAAVPGKPLPSMARHYRLGCAREHCRKDSL